jgi:predicted RNA-binding protein with PIN domain
MRYLIDGYNLMHAFGSLEGREGPTALRRARQALLDRLHREFGEKAGQLTVVFDAAAHPAGAPAQNNYQGIEVLFAVREASADELIEVLIRQAAVPRQLTVVSDDHRIQQASSRRDCIAMGCSEFLEAMEGIHTARRALPQSPVEKPQAPSESENRYWLREFAELENDPKLKYLSDPLEWTEDSQ